MAFGAVRAPYSARATFFADGLAGENRINWYIVPDDTPIYEGITPFWPRVDVPLDEALMPQQVYEEQGNGRTVRQKDWLLVFHPPAPHGVHGDDEDFRGKALHEKYGPDPLQPCVVPRVMFQGFEEEILVHTEIDEEAAGIEYGAVVYTPAAPLARAGIEYGLRVGMPLLRAPIGFEYGVHLIDRDFLKGIGIQYGVEVVEAGPERRIGMEYGCRVLDGTPGTSCEEALELLPYGLYTYTLSGPYSLWFKFWVPEDETVGIYWVDFSYVGGAGDLPVVTFLDAWEGSSELPCFIYDGAESTNNPDQLGVNVHPGNFIYFEVNPMSTTLDITFRVWRDGFPPPP